MDIEVINDNCIDVMERMAKEGKRFKAIITDPPYLYLTGAKVKWIEQVFNEERFFALCSELLEPKGFLIFFGRGESFYRWGTICSKFKNLPFKEELVWAKTTGGHHT